MKSFKMMVETNTWGSQFTKSLINIVIQAENSGFAMSLAEAQYGKGSVKSGPSEVQGSVQSDSRTGRRLNW